MAALATGTSKLSNVLLSDDTQAFMQALQKLGVKITLDPARLLCVIEGCEGVFPVKKASLWCHDAGTAARFLLVAAAASKGEYQFDGSEQLQKRPLTALIDALKQLGATIIPTNALHFPLTVANKDLLKGGKVTIDASKTGQFVSALLMMAPFTKTSLIIQAEGMVSESYIAMTCDLMAEFGVLVRCMHQGRFSVPIPQSYRAIDLTIEPDFSTASYFFAASAITGGQVTIQPVNYRESKQGDVQFLEVLVKMGCTVLNNTEGLTVQGPLELKGVNVDMRDFSDTFMTLAVLAPFAKTPTTITNIGHTRYKESNRITVMRQELEKCRVKVEEGKDWLKIYPSRPEGAVIDAHGDHRIAMAFAVLGLRVSNMEINGAECVSKTCPEFFALWEQLA